MTDSTITATAIGGPTLLLQYAGLRLLTDPTFDPPGDYPRDPHEPLHKTAGPAISSEAVGDVDAVLLSHDHHVDNLDRAGRDYLPRAATVITTTLGARRLGGNATGLEEWQSLTLRAPGAREVIVTAVPAQHGPDGTDHLTGPVIGFVVRSDGWPSLYISGDNASVAVVTRVSERAGPLEIAVLFAGGAWAPPINDYLTLTSARAAQAARILDARAVIPTHFEGWGHFREGFDELTAAFAAAGLSDRLLPAFAGATVHVAVEDGGGAAA